MALPDEEPAPPDGRRASDRVRSVDEWCRHRAEQKSDHAKLVAPLRYARMPHDWVRERVGLTVGEYRRARRWVADAVALCVASKRPMTLDDALQVIADRHVGLAVQLGRLREEGATSREIRDQLEIGAEEYEIADEWYRDAMTATVPRSDD